MIEVILFLGIMGLLFFMPVYFEISYRKLALDDRMDLELRFCRGLFKRHKVISFLKPAPMTPLRKEKTTSRWLFWRKKDGSTTQKTVTESIRDVKRFRERLRHFGIGITLLSYFLPANYQSWLLVVEDLEHKGRFNEFSWALRIGTEDPAATALLFGFLTAVGGILINALEHLASFDKPPQITMAPNFQKASLDTFFHCIFRIKLGHIIIAALWARFRYRFLKGGASH